MAALNKFNLSCPKNVVHGLFYCLIIIFVNVRFLIPNQGCIFFQMSFIYPSLNDFSHKDLWVYILLWSKSNIFLYLTCLLHSCRYCVKYTSLLQITFIICLLFALSRGQNLKVLCINLVFLFEFLKVLLPVYKRLYIRLLRALTVVSYDFLLLWIL